MPGIKVTVTHQLTPPDALARVKQFVHTNAGSLPNEVKLKEVNWTSTGGSFKLDFKSITVNGKLSIMAGKIILNSTLPLLLWPFKKQIENVIKERAFSILK